MGIRGEYVASDSAASLEFAIPRATTPATVAAALSKPSCSVPVLRQ
jgi:hypothetical protein